MAQEGTFVWYDLMTTDLSAAMTFYSQVIGWEVKDSGMPGPRPYMLVHGSGGPVGGAIQFTDEACAAGEAHTGWMGHVYAPYVDGAARQVIELGGKVLREPSDIPGVGRFAVVADPHGASFSLFANAPEYPMRPRLPMGALGHVGWVELHAGALDEAWSFYSALFGWRKDVAVEMPGAGLYQTFRDAETPEGGVAMGGMMTKMADTPVPHWLFYFSVEAAGAGADRVKAGGGQVLMGPYEVPGGGWIVIALDPQGGLFALLADKP